MANVVDPSVHDLQVRPHRSAIAASYSTVEPASESTPRPGPRPDGVPCHHAARRRSTREVVVGAGPMAGPPHLPHPSASTGCLSDRSASDVVSAGPPRRLLLEAAVLGRVVGRL